MKLNREGVQLNAEERNKRNQNWATIEIELDKAADGGELAKLAQLAAEDAKTKVGNVQQQVNELTVSGDSSPQATQASVGADGTSYGGNLKARLDAEQNAVTAQLADKAQQAELEAQKLRVDNLVIPLSPENANIEVTDAQVSLTKSKTFDSIGKRHEETETDFLNIVQDKLLTTEHAEIINQLPGVNAGTLLPEDIRAGNFVHSYVDNVEASAPFSSLKVPKLSRFKLNHSGTGTVNTYMGFYRRGVSTNYKGILGFWVRKSDLTNLPAGSNSQIRMYTETYGASVGTIYDYIGTEYMTAAALATVGNTITATHASGFKQTLKTVVAYKGWLFVSMKTEGVNPLAVQLMTSLHIRSSTNTTSKIDIMGVNWIDNVNEVSPYFLYPRSAGEFKASSAELNAVKETIPQITKAKAELLLPDKMYFIHEEKLRLYKTSIVDDFKNRFSYDLAVFSQISTTELPYIEQQREKIELDSTKMGNTFSVFLADEDLEDYTGKVIQKVSCVAANVLNKNPIILMFGDSTTQRGLAFRVKKTLDAYIAPTFIGTTTDGGGTPTEARGGWSLAQYIGFKTTHNNGTNMTEFPNFLKLATAEDKTNRPEWCFTRTFSSFEKNYTEATDKTQSFYIFDFAHYLSVNGYSAPHIVNISMGTNDLSVYVGESDGGVSILKKMMGIMIQQIRVAAPNAKISIVPLPIRAGGTKVDAPKKAWIKECVTNLPVQFPYIDVVAEYAHMSKEYIFDLSETKNAGRLDSTFTIPDKVHTSAVGLMEGAKPIAFYMLNQL